MKDNHEITQKKQYNPPVLTEYGEVAKLTEAHGTSSTSDHGADAMYPGV